MIAGRSPIFITFNYMDSDFERAMRDLSFNCKLFKEIRLKSYVVDLASNKFNASKLVKNIPSKCAAPRNNFILKLIHLTLITQFDIFISEAVEIRALYSDAPLLMLAKKDPGIGLTVGCAKTLTYNGVTLSQFKNCSEIEFGLLMTKYGFSETCTTYKTSMKKFIEFKKSPTFMVINHSH